MPADDVAVVITHYNRPELLRPTIEAALAQTHPPAEVVVVDDGSPSGIWDVEAEFPTVRLLTQENQGPAAARDAGQRATTAPLVCFCDGDDPLHPHALERAVAALRAEPDAGMTTGFADVIDRDGHVVAARLLAAPEPTDDLFAALLERTWVCPPGVVVYRRDALDAVGGWRGGDRHWGAEDYDVILRVAAKYPVAVIDEIVCSYRANEASMGSNLERVRDGIVHVLEDMKSHTAGDPRREAAREAGIALQTKIYDERIRSGRIADAWAKRRYATAARESTVYALRHPRTALRKLNPWPRRA